MKQLSEQTGESAYLSVPGHGETALYISITEGTHSVRHVSWVGRTVPTERSAVGVVLRGETPEAGYVAVARGVEDDVTAIAAPINLGGRTIAGLSLLVPSYRASDQRVSALGCLLAQVAADLSNQILPTPSTMPSPTTHEPPPPTTAAPDPPDGEGPASPANSATPSSPHNLLALAGRVRARRGDRAGAR
jgi:DNA-binding IclR family transcriptional regulator